MGTGRQTTRQIVEKRTGTGRQAEKKEGMQTGRNEGKYEDRLTFRL
jgi:hypothetical protein